MDRPCEGTTLHQTTNPGTIEAAHSVKSRAEDCSICLLVWIAERYEREYMHNHERLTTQTYERMGFVHAPELDFHPTENTVIKGYRLQLLDEAGSHSPID